MNKIKLYFISGRELIMDYPEESIDETFNYVLANDFASCSRFRLDNRLINWRHVEYIEKA